MAKPDDPDHPEWIERVVTIAQAFGLNPVKTRWKLLRWQQQRKQSARRLEQKADHIKYQHKTCDECGAVQDVAEKVCTRCGAKLGSRQFQVLRRMGLVAPVPKSMSMAFGLLLTIIYARVALAGGDFLNISGHTLVQFGGLVTFIVEELGQWWRLLTCALLHASLWHIGFNLLSLASIGPQIEALYGRMSVLFFFVVTALAGSLTTMTYGLDGVAIGASGGVCGLIGVALGYGQRAGTGAGRALRNDMLKWAFYVFIFGFAVKADNAAHAGGLICGMLLGWLIKPRSFTSPKLRPVRLTVEILAVLALLAAAALVLWPELVTDPMYLQ